MNQNPTKSQDGHFKNISHRIDQVKFIVEVVNSHVISVSIGHHNQ